MDMNVNNKNLYKSECSTCGPMFVNCCICIITRIAQCLICLKCNKNKENEN